MNNILILGHTGFIGKSLYKLLQKKGLNVCGVSSSECDLRSYSQVKRCFKEFKGIDVIYNLAAHVGSVHYVSEKAAEVITDNSSISLSLYKASKEIFPKALVINVLSNCSYPSGETRQSEDKWLDGPVHHSISAFGNYKRFLFHLSDSYKKQYNIETLNLMLPGIYGPGDHLDLNKVHALNGMIIRMITAKRENNNSFSVWGTGKPIREWIFIDDICSILEQSMHIKPAGPNPINVGMGSGLSIKETARLIAKSLKFKGELIFDSSFQDGDLIKVLKIKSFKDFFGNFSFSDHYPNIEKTVNYYNILI